MSSRKLESKFQRSVIKELEEKFDGCMVFKLDPEDRQGVPDLLVLYKKKWAALECKRSSKAKKQPNQEHYVSKMDKMSFSRFISPENKEEVLDDLQQTFRPRRTTRVSGSK